MASRDTTLSVTVGNDASRVVRVALSVALGGRETPVLVWSIDPTAPDALQRFDDVRSAVLERLDAVLEAYGAWQMPLFDEMGRSTLL
jgi:uncharacterized protein YcbX